MNEYDLKKLGLTFEQIKARGLFADKERRAHGKQLSSLLDDLGKFKKI